MTRHDAIPDDRRLGSTTTATYNGHDLTQVTDRVPGKTPSNVSAPLSPGPAYRTSYWECSRCSQQRNSLADFRDRCSEDESHQAHVDNADFDPFDVPDRVLKRAQYEAFAFEWLDGDIRVRNESHADPENHEYVVQIDDGSPVACPCPADAHFECPCKHRVALSIRPAVLEFVTATSQRVESDTSPLRSSSV